jgi:lactate dehydrogenase-like 2-hydroxyacid dehydrogenase
MKQLRLLVTIPVSGRCLSELSSLCDVITLPGGPGSGSPDFDGSTIEGVLTNGSTGLSADQMARMPKLKLICAYGAGYENIDIEAARRQGVHVTHAPNTNMETVADHALALMLAVSREICVRDRALREGGWALIRSARPTLSGARLGIIGLGNIGKAIAHRAGAFGMHIAYTTRSKIDVPWNYYPGVTALAANSDFLVVACPGSPSTRHLVNETVLEALGQHGFLINISRGMVVDTEALVFALENDRIAGAGLDVFEGEPALPKSLRKLDNVVLTPHMAGRSPASERAQIDALMHNLRSCLAGNPLMAQLA